MKTNRTVTLLLLLLSTLSYSSIVDKSERGGSVSLPTVAEYCNYLNRDHSQKDSEQLYDAVTMGSAILQTRLQTPTGESYYLYSITDTTDPQAPMPGLT